jgi:hypothetical protein
MNFEIKLGLALAVLGGVAFFLYRSQGGNLMQDAAAGAVGTVVDMTADVATGTVIGIGQVVGIPKTNMSECERAKAEGRTWDASFACSAGDFLKYVF